MLPLIAVTFLMVSSFVQGLQDSHYSADQIRITDAKLVGLEHDFRDGRDPYLVTVLQRCLADVACSQALSAASSALTTHDVLSATEVAVGHGVAYGPLPPTDATAAANPLFSHSHGNSGALVHDGSLLGGPAAEESTSLSLKAVAALILLAEAVAGMYLPLLLRRLQSPQWWLSLLNCFSGGIFLAAGIIHLLPHCQEAQEALGPIGPLGSDYPLYLVLVVVGYCVVFYVERVLFDVHGEGHWHCQHSNVFSHSSYYKAISHRSQRAARQNSGSACNGLPACGRSGDLPRGLPETASHPQSPRLCHSATQGVAAGRSVSSGTSAGGASGGGAPGHGGVAAKPPVGPEAAAIARSECDGGAEVDLEAGCGYQGEAGAGAHHHHHHHLDHHDHHHLDHSLHQHQHQHQHQHAFGSAGAGAATGPAAVACQPAGEPSAAAAAGGSRGGSTATSMQTCEEADDEEVGVGVELGVEADVEVGAAALVSTTGGGAEDVPASSPPLPLPDEEDAESCHSDHSPRAVCVCVEAAEVASSGAGGPLGYDDVGAAAGRAGHQHSRRGQRRMGQRRASYEAVRGGEDGGGGGAGEADALCAPLLEAVSYNADGSAAGAPPLPVLALPLTDVFGTGAGSGGAGAGGGPGGDLRGLAWAHLHQQHVQQLQEQEAAEAAGAEAGARGAHHHHHHHHAHARRTRESSWPRRHSVDCAAAADGPLSSCLLPASHQHQISQLLPHAHSHGGPGGPAGHAHGHLNNGHGHAHTHGHNGHNGHNGHDHSHGHHGHSHVHHAIQPRFRFMHGVVLLLALALHTALECVALGLMDERAQFMVLFVAIASHKAVSSLALSSRFLKEGATMMQVTAYVGPFCLVAPLSILAGVYVGRVAPLARLVFSCFATGTFLYVGASEVIMEEFEGEMRADRRDISTRAARYIKFGAVLLAVALVAASGLLPDADH